MRNIKKYKLSLLLVFIVFVLLCSLYFARIYKFRDPDYTFKHFLNNTELSEDQNIDPLILCPKNKQIELLVIKSIEQKTLPKRRYAIEFLRRQKANEALSILEKIVLDTTETGYMRGDALEAIYEIDKLKGKALAKAYIDNDGHLAKVADGIINGEKCHVEKRSYIEAFFGVHR